MNRRTALLALLVTLGAAFFFEQRDLPSFGPLAGGGGQSRAQLQARLDALVRYESARAAIDSAYVEIGIPYAERVAELSTFVTEPVGDGAAFAAGGVRRILDEVGAFRILALEGSAAGPATGSARAYQINVVFSSGSDAAALAAVALLGMPERGYSWNHVTVAADRANREVHVTGNLTAIVVEAAE